MFKNIIMQTSMVGATMYVETRQDTPNTMVSTRFFILPHVWYNRSPETGTIIITEVRNSMALQYLK
jgi:hypothetical protein